MPLIPYFGITDFMNFDQVKRMLDVLHFSSIGITKRKLHVGVMMSYKTLNDIPSRWQNAFPPKDMIASIFQSDDTLNCLHYADYENNPDLSHNLAKAIGYGGVGIHAVQLDMIWPAPEEIANGVHFSRKYVEIILQIGGKALEKIGNDPAAVVEKLREYDGLIHRILLDKSGGKGLGMDAAGLLPYAHSIQDAFPNIGIGAAGGLGPDTLNIIAPLIKEFPDLSFDAQGKLRPSGDALDPIDWYLAAKYLQRALKLCG